MNDTYGCNEGAIMLLVEVCLLGLLIRNVLQSCCMMEYRTTGLQDYANAICTRCRILQVLTNKFASRNLTWTVS